MSKKVLRTLAWLLLVATLAVWVAAGANRGWTKTSVPHKLLDEVTGIEGVTYERRFVPGLDFLAAALLVSLLLGGIALIFRKRQPQST